METRNVEQLEPNPFNPRGAIAVNAALEELAASIKSVGLLQPLVITPTNIVIAGHRRLQAARLAGLVDVPVVIRDVSEVEQIALMLIENLQRQDLNPAQEGMAYLHLINRGLKVSEICEAVGTCAAQIKIRVAIASLPPDARRAYAAGELPMNTAVYLKNLSADDQVRWVQRAVKGRWASARFLSELSRSQEQVTSVANLSSRSDTREKHITTAIKRLYDITDALEEYDPPRSALLLIADGIRQLEQEVKKGRKVA